MAPGLAEMFSAAIKQLLKKRGDEAKFCLPKGSESRRPT